MCVKERYLFFLKLILMLRMEGLLFRGVIRKWAGPTLQPLSLFRNYYVYFNFFLIGMGEYWNWK
jgi:hypothetical protein